MSILCKLGFHKWRPKDGNMEVVRYSKWDLREIALGVCDRNCGVEEQMIERDYYW